MCEMSDFVMYNIVYIGALSLILALVKMVIKNKAESSSSKSSIPDQKNMLEGPSSNINCETSEKTVKRNSRNGKNPVENDEDGEDVHAKKKSKKRTDIDNGLETRMQGNEDPALAFPDPIIPHQQVENQIDNDINSLIPGLGRDDSINCVVRCPRVTYAMIATLNRSFRELIRSGEIYRHRSNNGVIEHWVYFSCNPLEWEGFDPINRRWINLPQLEANETFERCDKESMGVGTELLVIGFDIFGTGIYKYNLITNSWSSGRPMNRPRNLFGSASIGQTAIFAGGIDRHGTIVDTVERYDSTTGYWETLPSLLKPRKLSSGVYMDKKFYVIGGSGQDQTELKCGEEFDFDEQRWTEIPNMSPGGGSGTMAPPLLATVDNELYAADCATMTIKMFDKRNREWHIIGNLPPEPANQNGWGIAFRGCGNRLIVIGGPAEGAYVEIYSWAPSEGPPQWTMLGRKRSYNFVSNCTIMGC